MFVASSHCMREVALNIKYLYEAIHTYTSMHDYLFSFNNLNMINLYFLPWADIHMPATSGPQTRKKFQTQLLPNYFPGPRLIIKAA